MTDWVPENQSFSLAWLARRSNRLQRFEPLLAGVAEVIVPELRGFGDSDKHPAEAEESYSGSGQAKGIIGLMDALGSSRPFLADTT